MTGRVTIRGIRGRVSRSLFGAVLTVDRAGKVGYTTRDKVLSVGSAAAGGGGVPLSANPSATAKDTAVNGTATTYMTSDSAPAVQKCSASLFGLCEVDGTTIAAVGGVISAVQPIGANPTGTAKDTAVNGSAATFMRSDAAPAVQKASSSQFGIVEVDNTTITAVGGVISAPAGSKFAFPPITAPAAPASGFIMYCDAADNKLKTIAASSLVTTLATQ